MLGIEIRRHVDGYLLVQVRDVVKRFNIKRCKSRSTALKLGSLLYTSQQPINDKEGSAMVDIPYRSAIGSLMYLAICTQPDLAASVSELSKFRQNPKVAHWEGVRRMLRYVRGTVGERLVYKKGAQVEVWGYSDANILGTKRLLGEEVGTFP